MKIGFTGTQIGLNKFQKDKLKQTLLDLKCTELLHGDCIGADSQAHDIAKELGVKFFTIYPPSNWNKRAWKELEIRQQIIGHDYCKVNEVNVRWMPEKPYLDRNKDIVNDCEFLIACPKEQEETIRSGTWSIVRCARRIKKSILIISII